MEVNHILFMTTPNGNADISTDHEMNTGDIWQKEL
jgi:hypothetical protein